MVRRDRSSPPPKAAASTRRQGRRRYALQEPALDAAVEALIEQVLGDRPARDGELARQIVVTALRLLRDQGGGDLKLLNSAFKELRHASRVFQPYAAMRKVAVFGSARTPPEHPDFRQAHDFAERMVEEAWMVPTRRSPATAS